jgi:large subunit ribosomal protein L14e
MYETGRVCLKIAGREAGKYCVIVETVDDNFVMITGPKTVTGVKRRKCNIDHIEPTENMIEIGSKADDASIENLWKNSGLIEKLEIKVPVKKQFKKEAKEAKKKK